MIFDGILVVNECYDVILCNLLFYGLVEEVVVIMWCKLYKLGKSEVVVKLV